MSDACCQNKSVFSIKVLALLVVVNYLTYWLLQESQILGIMRSDLARLNTLSIQSFDEYCEQHGEWDMLSHRELYFKRSSAFYFVETDSFYVLFLVRNTTQLEEFTKQD
jgi:hypothetical protein